jgi:hypothetical protein
MDRCLKLPLYAATLVVAGAAAVFLVTPRLASAADQVHDEIQSTTLDR